ncbi:MAG: PAS domain-containing protein [Candidatus Sericytochromatia bacterium]|nr:PAS domain-containing protein [Candidatus Sericytochromatia bacterium]
MAAAFADQHNLNPGTWSWVFQSNQVRCNPELAALLGQANVDFPVSYQTYLNWVHPEDREGFHQTLWQARENKTAFFLEHRCLWGDGRIRYLEACGEPVLSPDGEIIGIRCYYRNISRRWLTESLLKETEANLRQVLETMPDAVLIINPLGGIVYLNQRAENLFGQERKYLLGKPITQLIPKHALASFEAFWQAFRSEPEREQLRSEAELWFDSLSQGSFPADLVLGVTSFKGPGNCIAIIRNISAFKQIENEIRSLNRDLEKRVHERTLAIKQAHRELAEAHHFSLQVLDALPSHICVLNPQGEMMLINAGWKNLNSQDLLQDHRYSLQTAYLQRCLAAELTDPLSHSVGKNLERLLENQTPGFQQEYPCEVGGRTLWFLLSARPFELGGKTHAVIAHQEITALKETEILLEKMRQQAESANLAKSTFLANMSHEIRTPLNAILGFSQLLQKNTNPHSEQAPYLEEINQSGQHLLRLINQILEIAQSESKQLGLQATFFSLQDLLSELTALFQPQAEAKQLAFVCDFPNQDWQIYTDRKKLYQVLFHLLSNALQFTAQGQVTFKAHLEKAETQCLHFSVRDSGIGMEPPVQARIFSPFAESEVGLKAPNRTGLGLSICKQYSLIMGGQLAVQSQKGKGSTFSLSLPLAEGRATEGVASPSPTDNAAGQVHTSLPEALTAQIENAILLGESETITELLIQVQPLALSQRLLALAEQYEYEALLKALN